MMLSCKDVTQLVSQSLDRKLPLRRRLSIRFHLLMCKLCSRFRRQMLFLRDAARQEPTDSEADELPSEPRLSADARQRLKQLLKDRSD